MAKNWSAIFQHNFQQPETVAEAIDRLMTVLEDEHKIALAMIPEKALVDLHFSLGMVIRNAFGLHQPGSKLLASCEVIHPDEASAVIISELWRTLQT